jgi:hypothetical protein
LQASITDAGTYVITAQNSVNTLTTECVVKVTKSSAPSKDGGKAKVDKDKEAKASAPPTAPGQPTASKVTKGGADLAWKESKTDGAKKVSQYVVEMKQPDTQVSLTLNYNGTIKQDWIECGRTAATKLTISSLTADTEYVFRVRAEIDGGTVYSMYSPTSTPVRTLVDSSAPEFSARLPGDMQVMTGATTVLTVQVGWTGTVLLLICSCSKCAVRWQTDADRAMDM